MSTISAGTTSTNALVNTGDTTGNLVFQTNGTTTAMTIDTSQNVGIGTASPSYRLDVTGQARATTGFAVSTDGSTFTPSGLNAIPNYGTGYITSTSRAALSGFGGLSFYTNQALSMLVDQSGNVGIGTSSPTFRMVAANSGTDGGWVYSSGATSILGLGGYSVATDGAFSLRYDRSTGNITFNGGTRDTPTERMRLDTNGNLLVGTTTNNGRISSLASGSGTAGYFASSGSTITLVVADSGVNGAGIALYGNGATTPNKYIRAQSGSLQFINNAYSQVMAVFADAGVYNTAVGGTNRAMYVDNGNNIGYLSSVRASKTNIAPMPTTDWLLQLQPKTFNYRKKDADGKYTDEADGGIQYGLIAEEVEQVRPDLCFYDEVDGKQELRGIHYEKLVVPMLKTIQELKTQNDELRARVAALEGAK